MWPPKDMSADVREVCEEDVAARWAGRRLAPDAYHASFAISSAVHGAVASAHARFSSRSAISAASRLACPTSSKVRRRAAAIVALTVDPGLCGGCPDHLDELGR